nr:hypothetical protein [Desulfosarcina alkanivorans]
MGVKKELAAVFSANLRDLEVQSFRGDGLHGRFDILAAYRDLELVLLSGGEHVGSPEQLGLELAGLNSIAAHSRNHYRDDLIDILERFPGFFPAA